MTALCWSGLIKGNKNHLAPLSDADLKTCARIWHEGWHAAHAAIVPDALTRLRTNEDFARRLGGLMSQTTVAMSGDDVLGFVVVQKDELYQMFVDEKAQGSGVAKDLMAHALAQIRANKAETAWLSCSIGNDRAAAFYRKMGWRNVGEETVAVDTSDGPFDLAVWRFERAL